MPSQEKFLIVLLTCIMVVKGVAWSLAFPLWQGPDEDDHYAVIQFVAEMGRLPDVGDEILPDEVTLSRQLADVGRLDYAPEQRQVFSETAVGPNEIAFAQLPAETRRTFELGTVGKLMHATPFYYVMAAGVYKLFDDGDLLWRAQVQRIFAVLVSSPVVVVAWLVACELFPQKNGRFSHLRLTIPILVAFHPQMTEITAVVSVDGFYILCYSLLIYLSLLVLHNGFQRRYALAMGLVFVAGMLTKPTLNGYVPLIALLIVYDAWKTGAIYALYNLGKRKLTKIPNTQYPFAPVKETFFNILLMGLVVLPPVGWWMQRSWRLNHDLFYFNPVEKGHRIVQNPFYDYTVWQHFLDFYQSVWGGIFTTWWAHFGWLDTPLPPWVYHVLRGLTFLAIAGLVRFVWQKGGFTYILRHHFPWFFLALSLIIPIVLLQFYDLTFWWQYGLGRGLQGRYWLGTVIPMLAFFVLGLVLWVPKGWETAVHTLLRVGMVLLNFVSLLGYIVPRYYL